MDKGIRAACNRKFVELLPQRAQMGNTKFRKEVMGFIMEQFGATLASAATHYNHAFKEAKKVPELAPLLEGLGRPEDKKGGRKKKVAPEATPAATQAPVALLTYTPSTPAANQAEDAGETTEAQKTFTVKKKSDDSVVAENVTFFEALEMVQKAKAGKKAALYYV